MPRYRVAVLAQRQDRAATGPTPGAPNGGQRFVNTNIATLRMIDDTGNDSDGSGGTPGGPMFGGGEINVPVADVDLPNWQPGAVVTLAPTGEVLASSGTQAGGNAAGGNASTRGAARPQQA